MIWEEAGGKDNPRVGLVGDIGGTNARFALSSFGERGAALSLIRAFRCEDYASPVEALRAYFDETGLKTQLDYICLAVAGQVKDGSTTFTNLNWTVAEHDLLGLGWFQAARVINDFTAQALSVPHLEARDVIVVGPYSDSAVGPIAVAGPGTGFGLSLLARGGLTPVVVSTEGGHISFAPVDDLEIEILKVMRKQYERVTVEHFLSGRGLVNLYKTLCAIRGETPRLTTPPEVTQGARDGVDAAASGAVDAFLAILGSSLGDYALALGATGGVYIAGGIVPKFRDRLSSSRFRERFEAKAPHEAMLRRIPTKIITYDYSALIGAAYAIDPHEGTHA